MNKPQNKNNLPHNNKEIASIKEDMRIPNKTELKINSLLSEFTALREESLLNFDQQQKLIIWFGTAIYILFALIIKFPDIKILYLFIPFLIFSWIGFTVKSDCKILVIASYLECISNKIDYLLNSRLMKWEDLAKSVVRRSTVFKNASSFILHIMILIPFFVIFIFSFDQGNKYLKEELKNNSLWINLFGIGVPIILALYLIIIIYYFYSSLKQTQKFCENELIKFKEIEKIF